MSHHRQYIPPPVRSLISHLDAALAACETLLSAQGAEADPHDLLRLELTAIAHVLQAREDMMELRLAGGAVRSQITLFLTVTACLEEPSSAPTIGTEASATRLIGGRIDVTTLMALMAAMRDLVEFCFLARDDDDAAAQNRPPPIVTETLVWATNPDGA
jgi:hypothetical protein